MRTAELYWIHQQLEPSDILITGKHKREPNRVIQSLPPGPVRLSEEEDNKKQDAYIEEQIAKQLNKTP